MLIVYGSQMTKDVTVTSNNVFVSFLSLLTPELWEFNFRLREPCSIIWHTVKRGLDWISKTMTGGLVKRGLPKQVRR